jgi:two-component system, HptB-dependent secretion and biofilm response regulator
MTIMATKSKTILIVDDERLNLNILVDLLDSDFTLLVAKNGAQALKRAEGKPKPDLILLDIMMPGMNGYEVLAILQKDDATRDIPVIFVTALGHSEDETRGFELGAVDYIRKPFTPSVVKARINTQLALREAYRSLEDKTKQLMYERSIIENIILRMRNSSPLETPNIYTVLTPVEKTAGDIVLKSKQSDGTLNLLLGDFTGHGLSAAVCAPMVDDLFSEMTTKGEKPEVIIEAINKKLFHQLPAGLFMAGVIMSWKEDEKLLRLWSFAMPEVVVIRGGECIESFQPKRSPLGIMPTIDPECHYRFQAKSGDRIILYSDGVIETMNINGELFGDKRFLHELTHNRIEKLEETLQLFRGEEEQADDITLVELSV